MSKEEFSDHNQETASTRRGGQIHGSFGGKETDRRVGEELGKEGAHTNVGVGDERIPIREDKEE